MQVAGQPVGSATQPCSHASGKHSRGDNANLQAPWGPGQNVAAQGSARSQPGSTMEGVMAEQLEPGKGCGGGTEPPE